MGKEWKTGGQLVFQNVGAPWNSVGWRKENVLRKAFQSTVATSNPAVCSLEVVPKSAPTRPGL